MLRKVLCMTIVGVLLLVGPVLCHISGVSVMVPECSASEPVDPPPPPPPEIEKTSWGDIKETYS
jgi:hypothetical protein